MSACSGGEREAPALSGVTAISAGFDSDCALIKDGSVRCWGRNHNGELGNTPTGEPLRDTWAAVAVQRVADAVSVSVAQSYACAALSDGAVKCWGKVSSRVLNLSVLPAFPVDGVTSARAVVTGRDHSCALLTDSTVQCWGDGSLAALGDGLLPEERHGSWSTPVAVKDLSDAKALAINSPSSCALRENGEVSCWGETWGEVDPPPDGSSVGRTLQMYTPAPRVIEGLADVTQISLGFLYSCAVLSDTTVACWGWLSEGMGGPEMPTAVPMPVADLSGAIAVATGDGHACALISDGSIRCWGSNAAGQLGDGSQVSSPVPVAVQGIDTAVAISAGTFRSCALLADSTVRCWGDNARGCTDGLCSSSSTPVIVRTAP
jgi:alpha-tubulin suppressor-like RCC1 family protein